MILFETRPVGTVFAVPGSACTNHSSPGLRPDVKSLRKEEHYDDCCANQWYVVCGSFDRSVDRSSGDGNGNGSREVTGNQIFRLLHNHLFPIRGINFWIVRPDSLEFLNTARILLPRRSSQTKQPAPLRWLFCFLPHGKSIDTVHVC